MEAVRFDDVMKNKGKVRGCFAMANERLDNLFGKERRTKEKVSLLLEPQLFQALPVFQSNSGTCFCQRTSPSTSITSETQVKDIQ